MPEPPAQPVISSTGLALLLGGLAGSDSVAATVVQGNDELSVAIRLPADPEPGSS